MYQLNIFHRNMSGDKWHVWMNRMFFAIPVIAVPEDMESYFRPVFQWERDMNKAGIHIVGMSWFPAGGTPENGTGSGWFTSSIRWNPDGQRARHGNLRFRDVCQLHLNLTSGRCGRSWHHGVIDEDEILRGEGNKAILKSATTLELQSIVDHYWDYGVCFDDLVTRVPMIGSTVVSAQKQVLSMAYPKYVDAHAVTRWRYRFQGGGEQTFETIFAMMSEMSRIWDVARQQYVENGDFMGFDLWIDAVAIIGAWSGVYQVAKNYLTDDSEQDPEQKDIPYSRFGLTSGKILDVLAKAKQKSDNELQELLKLYRPYQFGDGEQYVRQADMKPYTDLIKEQMYQFAQILEFDWFNPRATKEQRDALNYQGVPDIIELAV